MRWRRTLLVWVIIVALFSVYNLLPILSTSTEPHQTVQDPKILTYNFTMDKPSSVQDTFAAHVNLAFNPSLYTIRASVFNWFYLESYSALGEFQLNYTIYTNGINALAGDGQTANFGIVWSHQNYLLSAQGPIPDLSVQENMNNLHSGDNTFEFRFIQFSKLSQYGSGYYNLKLGPFNVM